MPKKIVLIRHGETDFNVENIMQGHLDTFLNPNGLRQAREIAQILVEENIDAIISSDLKRAYHTGIIIANELQKPITSTALLRERFYGSLQGLTKREITQFINGFGEEGKWAGGWMDEVFSIETDEQIIQRLQAFVRGLEQYRGKTVVVVTHGGTIRILLRLFDIAQGLVENFTLKNTDCLVLKEKNGRYELRV